MVFTPDFPRRGTTSTPAPLSERRRAASCDAGTRHTADTIAPARTAICRNASWRAVALHTVHCHRPMTTPTHPAQPPIVRPFADAHTHWSYVPSRPRLEIVLRRWKARLARRQFPAWKTIKAPATTGRWILYFMYLPQGQLSVAHQFTLERLAMEPARLMIVCASPAEHPVLDALSNRCDALIWKELAGYDFSGYSVGLSSMASHCPGSDVFVLNDSMLGPFYALSPFMDHAPWRLTGLSASALEENHLQSFALVIRQLDASFMDAVSEVISQKWCYDTSDPVILLQETRLARVASRHMSVGAYWYTDGTRHNDLTLNAPEALIEAGFPLLKRSLLDKFAGRFQSVEAMQALLQRLGHPALTE